MSSSEKKADADIDTGMEHKAQVVERDLLGEKLPLLSVINKKGFRREIWLDGHKLTRVVSVTTKQEKQELTRVVIEMYANVTMMEAEDG